MFIATQKLPDLNVSGGSGTSQGTLSQTENSGSTSTASVVQSTPMAQSSHTQFSQPQIFPQSQAQMFQPSQAHMFQPTFPQAPFFPQSSHRFNDNNRNRSRGQGFVSFPRTACQICGKDNHSARTCRFRNTQASGFIFPPPGFTTPGMVSSPGLYPSYGFQSPNIWRPEYSTQFSVPMPLICSSVFTRANSYSFYVF